MFELHTQLDRDCALLGDMELSRVLLRDDALYPWLILVPRRDGIEEIFQLGAVDRRCLLEEVSAAAAALAGHFRADKMNVAALGNIVPQLHVHVIARRRDDAAWPQPVWGARPPQPYTEDALRARSAELIELLQPLGLQAAQ